MDTNKKGGRMVYMKKVNLSELPDEPWGSPKGKYGMVSKNVSLALGRVAGSDKRSEAHAFDLELCRVPVGKVMCPYHSHTAQSEFYLVLSGRGQVRDAEGTTEVGPGDAFLFKPGEAHQLSCLGEEDFVFYIIADDPTGDACHYPDSGKVSYPLGGVYRKFTVQDAEYFDGEE
jgi:uncharacterized cupin superfamily protein